MKHSKTKFAVFILTTVVSMSATPNLVNGKEQSLSSVNKYKSTKGPEKEGADVTVRSMIDRVYESGEEGAIGKNLAAVIGLPKAMPLKGTSVLINKSEKSLEKRECYVIYEDEAATATKVATKAPTCAYLLVLKHSGFDRQTQYYRIDLNGKLVKAVIARSKIDATGNVVRGSGVKFDRDISSPEVRKAFEKEMAFWLKDWLPKQSKAAAPKAAAASSVKKPDSSPAR